MYNVNVTYTELKDLMALVKATEHNCTALGLDDREDFWRRVYRKLDDAETCDDKSHVDVPKETFHHSV